MKYSHVIYNSSERNRSGGVGFGVRSASAGMSPQLLAALEQNGVFTFRESNASLSPSALFENPDLIRQVPPSYFFRVVGLPGQEKAYVLGRRIAVGFDYTFYLNGRPGRLGNYVVDAYVFPECPAAEDFGILLESPAPGSNRFIPADPAPRAGNAEMREISVGHKPDLVEEERPFRAAALPEIDGKAVDLLFAFIESRKQGKPLLVKAAPGEAPRLMAALALMVPRKHLEEITFVTNHNEQGLRAGINICFIGRDYRFEIFPNLWVVLDLNGGGVPDTMEKTMFRPMVERYVREGQLRKVRALVAWCLSPTFEASKSAPQDTQRALFAYIHDYDAFDVRMLEKDPKLRELLAGYFRQSPDAAGKLEESLQKELDGIQHYYDLKSWIRFVRDIRPIEVRRLVERNRPRINEIVFRDSNAFKSFYQTFSNEWSEIVRDYIDDDKFLRYSYYLSQFEGKEWESLYPYFLKEIIGNKATLVLRMFADKVDSEARQRIIDREIPDRKRQAQVLVDILKSSTGEYDEKLLQMLVGITREAGECAVDFFREFAPYVSDKRYSGLFACQLELSDVGSAEGLVGFVADVKAFKENEDCERWLKEPSGRDALNRMLASLLVNLKGRTISRQKAEEVCRDVALLPVSDEIRRKISLLSHVLQHSTSYDDKEVEPLWKLARGIGDREYMAILARNYLRHVEKKKNFDPNILQKKSADYPEGLVAYMVKEGILSEENLLRIASADRYRAFYILGLMQMRAGQPQEEYDFLTQKAAMNDETALLFMEKYAPESHRKILKSRQPSVWSKISGGLKGMFAKKDRADDDEGFINGRQAPSSRSGKNIRKDEK
ncbi:MAG: hypothetical protein K2L11_01865 [Muribaculaceae bacterium]|nr:hypothetical protein [Muribaculaceae bacterium]